MKNWLAKISHSPATPAGSRQRPYPADELPLDCEPGAGIEVPLRQEIIIGLAESCQLQLEMLRHAMQLTSVVLLWRGPGPQQLSVYRFSSAEESLLRGPFELGVGVTGAILKTHHELILAPVRASSPAIPYYCSNQTVGSFLAVRLPFDKETAPQDLALLCLDRKATDGWSEGERQLISLTAEKLVREVQQARALFSSDRERHAYRRAFDGLQQLNAALGLRSAFEATARAIRSIVPPDFIAISLAEESQHRIAYSEGENAEKLADQVFPREQGLVGQVLKYSRTLPDKADYNGTSPVFSAAHLFAEYRSLMIVPLRRDEASTAGALIVAARQQGAFSRTCRDILELVATQVAIKIDLAHSHEQINRMATIDSLTGIANRRAYQCGFEAMLDRASRRAGGLHLVLCDIDHFKRINDTYGHPFGDEVLRQVAKLFESVVRAVDLAARTGGEEFAILLEDADEQGAWKVAERLRTLVEELDVRCQGERVPVTISLGIAAFPEHGRSMEKLVSCADQALYQAKRSGRNRTLRWDEQSAPGPG